MTLHIDVVSDESVLNVLTKANQPLPTLDVADRLASTYDVEIEEVNVTRMRRSLDRLEEQGVLVASGGPKRDDLPGWPSIDKRDVLWATRKVADRIADEYARIEQERVEQIERRVYLLKELHKRCLPDQRDALGITGLFQSLKQDPAYSNGQADGATHWSLPVLEAVCELIGIT